MTKEKLNLGQSFDKFKDQPFNDIPTDISERIGYLKCLNQLTDYLQEVTEWKAEKRFIDSVPILEGIKRVSKRINDGDTDDIPSDMFGGKGETSYH